jgi:hypothetical protein
MFGGFALVGPDAADNDEATLIDESRRPDSWWQLPSESTACSGSRVRDQP